MAIFFALFYLWIDETKKESIEALESRLENENLPIEKSDNLNNKKDVDGSPSKKRHCPGNSENAKSIPNITFARSKDRIGM